MSPLTLGESRLHEPSEREIRHPDDAFRLLRRTLPPSQALFWKVPRQLNIFFGVSLAVAARYVALHFELWFFPSCSISLVSVSLWLFSSECAGRPSPGKSVAPCSRISDHVHCHLAQSTRATPFTRSDNVKSLNCSRRDHQLALEITLSHSIALTSSAITTSLLFLDLYTHRWISDDTSGAFDCQPLLPVFAAANERKRTSTVYPGAYTDHKPWLTQTAATRASTVRRDSEKFIWMYRSECDGGRHIAPELDTRTGVLSRECSLDDDSPSVITTHRASAIPAADTPGVASFSDDEQTVAMKESKAWRMPLTNRTPPSRIQYALSKARAGQGDERVRGHDEKSHFDSDYSDKDSVEGNEEDGLVTRRVERTRRRRIEDADATSDESLSALSRNGMMTSLSRSRSQRPHRREGRRKRRHEAGERSGHHHHHHHHRQHARHRRRQKTTGNDLASEFSNFGSGTGMGGGSVTAAGAVA